MRYLKNTSIRVGLFLLIISMAAAFQAYAQETQSGRRYSVPLNYPAGQAPAAAAPTGQTEFPNLTNRHEQPQFLSGHTNERNQFSPRQVEQDYFQGSGGCNRDIRCPSGMRQVCHPGYQIKVCMDVELVQDGSGNPRGNINYNQCRDHCASRGARLPSNNEWLVAALGTDRRQCLHEGDPPSPPGFASRTTNGRMGDTSFNLVGIRRDRQCTSAFGINDMVGVLGQHVTHGQAGSNRIQFNGGLWAMPGSSIFYRTTAHGATYSDYSLGCRCAYTP